MIHPETWLLCSGSLIFKSFLTILTLHIIYLTSLIKASLPFATVYKFFVPLSLV